MVDPPYRMKNMMPGMIMLWYGSIATIPSGWHLCDGTMGTPNLGEKFVVGAHVFLAPGSTGGGVNHTHDFTGDGHWHQIDTGTDIAAGADYDSATNPESALGKTDIADSRPPYHALCYIMKL